MKVVEFLTRYLKTKLVVPVYFSPQCKTTQIYLKITISFFLDALIFNCFPQRLTTEWVLIIQLMSINLEYRYIIDIYFFSYWFKIKLFILLTVYFFHPCERFLLLQLLQLYLNFHDFMTIDTERGSTQLGSYSILFFK